MPDMTVFPIAGRAARFLLSRFPAVVVLSLALGLFAGCAPRGGELSQLEPDERYAQDVEVVVYPPYVPGDDGIPLTSAEAEAFNSRGVIDADLSQDDIQDVERNFKFFVHEQRSTMQRYVDRSARFLSYIKKVFREKGVPEEIAYLCMVESGGNPNAVSPAGAAGLWQFMPFTGKKYGLAQSSWYDERRDPYKATYAAADYLLKLYGDFNDWHLAIAAYNAGEGKIGRALNGTGATNFFDLCRLDGELDKKTRLRDETRQYVPRFIAVTKIMRNLKRLGFTPPSDDNAWDLETLDVPPGSDLAGLARNVGLTWDEFAAMNPAYRRTASPPAAITTAYIIPDKKKTAQQWLASAESRVYADWREYKVQRRDTLTGISKRNNISVASLRRANNFTKLPKAGSVILIPGRAETVKPVYDAQPKGKYTAAAGVRKYTVRSGDTLFDLARLWGTGVDSIRQVNRMDSDESKLSLGQRLSIPADSKNLPAAVAAGAARSAAAEPRVYHVRSGDTLYSIARTHDITVNDLRAANGLDPGESQLKIGQSLQIPAKGSAAAESNASARPAQAAGKGKTAEKSSPRGSAQSAAKGKNTVITVASGDTLYALARKYNTSVRAIQQANKLGNGNALKLGQKLVMP